MCDIELVYIWHVFNWYECEYLHKYTVSHLYVLMYNVHVYDYHKGLLEYFKYNGVHICN